jgi:hypothetical protein
MLEAHAKKVGFDPYTDTPSELNQYMHEDTPEAVHKFKAHRSDLLALDDHKEELSKAEQVATTIRILKKYSLVKLLKGDVIPFPGNPAPAVDQGKAATVLRHPAIPAPLYKPGHRVLVAGNPGTVQQVHVYDPRVGSEGQEHMYHVKGDHGQGGTYRESKLSPHK